MNNPIIQTDIAEILTNLSDGQIKLLEEMRSGQKEMLGKIETIDKRLIKLEGRFDAQEQIVTELKESQNRQIWALIGLAFTAVISLLVGLGKFIFFPNP